MGGTSACQIFPFLSDHLLHAQPKSKLVLSLLSPPAGRCRFLGIWESGRPHPTGRGRGARPKNKSGGHAPGRKSPLVQPGGCTGDPPLARVKAKGRPGHSSHWGAAEKKHKEGTCRRREKIGAIRARPKFSGFLVFWDSLFESIAARVGILAVRRFTNGRLAHPAE